MLITCCDLRIVLDYGVKKSFFYFWRPINICCYKCLCISKSLSFAAINVWGFERKANMLTKYAFIIMVTFWQFSRAMGLKSKTSHFSSAIDVCLKFAKFKHLTLIICKHVLIYSNICFCILICKFVWNKNPPLNFNSFAITIAIYLRSQRYGIVSRYAYKSGVAGIMGHNNCFFYKYEILVS